MTSQDTIDLTDASGAAEDSEPRTGIFESLLGVFRETSSEDLDKACERFGFGFFHSLPPEEQLLHREQMGIKCVDAVDHYNLGVAYASQENFDEAVACWKRALKDDPDMPEALFNLAVAYERDGKTGPAKTHYERYLETVEESDDIEEVRAHLAQL